MRESIGTSFMLNFIILFIFLVFAFLAGTLSYYKAYRINNYLVNAIEKYEGYNDYSREEIAVGMKSLGYSIAVKTDCPPDREITHISYESGQVSNYRTTGELVNEDELAGYCIYLYMNDNAALSKGGGLATTDTYYTYGILTYMQLRFPVVESVLKIPIFSRTNRMYYFG